MLHYKNIILDTYPSGALSAIETPYGSYVDISYLTPDTKTDWLHQRKTIYLYVWVSKPTALSYVT
jgi:hypothetical protein